MAITTVSSGTVSGGSYGGGRGIFEFVTVVDGGQLVSSTVYDNGSVQVGAGGIASNTTERGAYLVGYGLPSLNVSSGGMAIGTVLNGPSDITVNSGGTASATIVNSSAEDFNAGGTETGVVVRPNATLFVAGGFTGADIQSGSTAIVRFGAVSGTIETGAVLSSVDYPGGFAGTLQPGGSVDYGAIPYSPGLQPTLTASPSPLVTIYDAARNQDIVIPGVITTSQTVLFRDDGVRNMVTGLDGTLVTEFNAVSTPAGSTIDTAVPGAATVIASAAYDASVAQSVTGYGASVMSAAIGNGGGQSIVSVADGAAHVLTAFGTGPSVIAAGGGNDTVNVGSGVNLIATGHGVNTVTLASGVNTVVSEGTDIINAGTGSDTATISGQTVVNAGSASLFISLLPNARLTLTAGTGTVQVLGGFGSGTFTGGTNGHNLLVAGTGSTTLYAGGDGDVLMASGGASTTMYGYGGVETMAGQFSKGTDVFNFNAANVFATGGGGQNVFNIGSGANNIVAGAGTGLFNVTSGAAGGSTFIARFDPTLDHVHFAGYAADEITNALGTATMYDGSEVLHLRDGTTVGFGGVSGLMQSSFV